MTTRSVTDNQGGTQQAQATDPAKSQFGVAQVSSQTPGTYTEADLERERQRVRSDVGRKHAEELRTLRQRQENAELEAVRGNPEAFDALKARQEAGRREDEANQKLAEAQELETRATAALTRAERLEANATARELGTKYSVDPSLLIRFTDGKVDKMEDLAQLLPKVTPSQPPAATTTTTTTNPLYRPDSLTNTGSGNLSLDALVKTDIKNMTPSQLREHQRLIEAQAKGLPR